MSELTVNVNPDSINKYIADKIMESALGTRLNKSIDEALKGLNRFGDDPLKDAVTAEVQNQIMLLVREEFSEKIRESVRVKMTDGLIDMLVVSFIQNLTASADRH